MKLVAGLILLVIFVGATALPGNAQRLNVDPAHPYSSSEQKQADKLYKKSLKQQAKSQKKNEKAQRKAWKKQQKEADRVNRERQKQIDQTNHH